jgi:hypothetical protein
MKRNLIRYAALAAVLGSTACADALVVANPNDPDATKVLATPADAEALIGSYYKRWFAGVYSQDMEGRLNIWSFQNFSSLNNNCQNESYPFTGAFINNTPGLGCTGLTYRIYQIESEVNRIASTLLREMDAGLSMGTVARSNRARAFAEFLNGMAAGYMAMQYDSAAIVTPAMSSEDAGALEAYTVVAQFAYDSFDRAIALANDPASTANDGFPLPPEWIPSPTSMTAAEFVKLIRSYKARIRANMARTPTDVVDWALVIADAAAGFTADHYNITGTTIGGTQSVSWRQQYNTFSTWHQMTPFILGMADNSGTYAAWIAQPLGDRGAGNNGFFMTTPDLRFPQGGSRAAQQADFILSSCETPNTFCKRYFVNRSSGNDQFSGVGWGWSNYDFARFRSWHIAGDAGVARQGKAVVFTLAELDLLRAEGLFKTGDFAGAAALINKTRTAGMGVPSGAPTGHPAVALGGGLPAITVFDASSPVPGGPDCVPKVPSLATPTQISCGNMFEALKWEKRIETAYTHYAPWYFDGRRWGDLPENAPLWAPVPSQDWLARGKPANLIYHTGSAPGSAPGSAAPRGNYGW